MAVYEQKSISEAGSWLENDTSTLKELETQPSTKLVPGSTNFIKMNAVDNDAANIRQLLGSKSNIQLRLRFKNIAEGERLMNGVDVNLEQDGFIIRDFIYDIWHAFISFLTKPEIKKEDFEDEDEKRKTSRFLRDNRYDTGKADKKIKGFRRIKRLLEMRSADVFGWV